MLFGSLFCRFTLDRILNYARLRRQRKAQTEAGATDENFQICATDRLLVMLPATILVPAGLFMYGWTLQARAPWIVPLIGTGLVGFGLAVTMTCTFSYMVDRFGKHAASALAAPICLRNLFGAFLPLAGPILYKNLGYGWGNSLLGFLAIAFAVAPLYAVCKHR